MKNKKMKMSLGDMTSVAVSFVVVGIVLGLAGTILTQIATTQTAGSYAANSTTNAQTSIATLSGYVPLLATVAAASIVIGLVVRFLAGGKD